MSFVDVNCRCDVLNCLAGEEHARDRLALEHAGVDPGPVEIRDPVRGGFPLDGFVDVVRCKIGSCLVVDVALKMIRDLVVILTMPFLDTCGGRWVSAQEEAQQPSPKYAYL